MFSIFSIAIHIRCKRQHRLLPMRPMLLLRMPLLLDWPSHPSAACTDNLSCTSKNCGSPVEHVNSQASVRKDRKRKVACWEEPSGALQLRERSVPAAVDRSASLYRYVPSSVILMRSSVSSPGLVA